MGIAGVIYELEEKIDKLKAENERLKESIKRWENQEIHEAMECYKENKANAVWREIAVELYNLDPILHEWSSEGEWDVLEDMKGRIRELLEE